MADPTHNGRPIAEPRRTGLGLYVTAKEAYDMWQADPEGVKILDVRTPEEWVFTGHAPMATLIPFAFMAYVWDAVQGRVPLVLEPRLRRDGRAAVHPRRHTAHHLPLRRACGDGDQPAGPGGFTTPTTSSTAWKAAGRGSRQRLRRHPAKNGWKNSGLPWTYELDPDQMALPGARDRRAPPRQPGGLTWGRRLPGTGGGLRSPETYVGDTCGLDHPRPARDPSLVVCRRASWQWCCGTRACGSAMATSRCASGGPARAGGTRGHAIWVSDMFAWRGSPAAWNEEILQVTGVSARPADTEEQHKLRRLGDEVRIAVLSRADDEDLEVAQDRGPRGRPGAFRRSRGP